MKQLNDPEEGVGHQYLRLGRLLDVSFEANDRALTWLKVGRCKKRGGTEKRVDRDNILALGIQHHWENVATKVMRRWYVLSI